MVLSLFMEGKNKSKKYNVPNEFQFPNRDEILSVLKEDWYVRNRIYNIRHGDTKTKWNVPDNEGLIEWEVERIKNIQWIRLKKYGLNINNTVINFAWKAARIKETADAIIEVLKIKKKNIHNDVSELDTIERDNRNQQEWNANLVVLAGKCSKFLLELFKILETKEEWENIINSIVINFSLLVVNLFSMYQFLSPSSHELR